MFQLDASIKMRDLEIHIVLFLCFRHIHKPNPSTTPGISLESFFPTSTSVNIGTVAEVWSRLAHQFYRSHAWLCEATDGYITSALAIGRCC